MELKFSFKRKSLKGYNRKCFDYKLLLSETPLKRDWYVKRVIIGRKHFLTKAISLSHVQLFVTPWTVGCQAPLSMGFSRPEYCSWLPFVSPGALLDPGVKLPSSALAGGFFASKPPGKPIPFIQIDNSYRNDL